jgi:CheY-like chemotaxis protein
MKLMLVDDDHDDRTLFCEALLRIDPTIECEFATDGVDALQKLKNSERLPDAIFMDVNMPFMDGRECFDQLKSDKRLRDIRVVMLSTSSSDRDVNRFENLGGAYMVKPPSFEALVKSLHSHISKFRTTTILLSIL